MKNKNIKKIKKLFNNLQNIIKYTKPKKLYFYLSGDQMW